MKRVETPEFSIEANPMFGMVRVFAGSIGLRYELETTFSPMMNIGPESAKEGLSAQDWLTDALKDSGCWWSARR
jgi:hypothetical protein